MAFNFDSTQHLHLGYYGSNIDLEAIAYKVNSKDKWIIFLDNEQDLCLVKGILNQYDFYERYGYEIFSINAKDLSYDYGVEKFTEWLKANKVI